MTDEAEADSGPHRGIVTKQETIMRTTAEAIHDAVEDNKKVGNAFAIYVIGDELHFQHTCEEPEEVLQLLWHIMSMPQMRETTERQLQAYVEMTNAKSERGKPHIILPGDPGC